MIAHAFALCVRFPWTEVRACQRCGLVLVNSEERNAISFMRPPPKGEQGSYPWFELEPTPGSLRHLTPFVASAPLRDAPSCIPAEAA